jgi:endonuclease/exonuclease/phosphatase family metal-dependent hydrolase
MIQVSQRGKRVAWTLLCLLAVTQASASVGPDHAYPEQGPFYTGEYGPPPSKMARDSSPIRVVSYNVNFSRLPGRIIDDLSLLPDLADADLILLQEITGPVGGKRNAAETIARALGLNYVYSPGMVFQGRDYGNAILSRWPLSRFKKVNLPRSTLEDIQRTAMVADVEIHGHRIAVASVHLTTYFPDSLGSEQLRAEQFSAVFSKLPSDPSVPVIFGGDLNTFRPLSRRRIFDVTEDRGFEDMHPIDDWTMRYLHFRLDHLFARRGAKVLACGVTYEAGASDHAPIWSQIVL